MRLKVCGITSVKQIKQLDALNVGYAGLIFYEKSPRYVVGKISPEEVKDADFDIKLTGVFVDAPEAYVYEQIDAYGLQVVQLHGSESPDYCMDLQDEVEVIKAFHIPVSGTTDIDKLVAPYDDACDYYLFDSLTADGQKGGTGEKFDWQMLKNSRIEKPFFLSGGIGLDDAQAVKSFSHLDFYAVDINSRFESSPGVKNLPDVISFQRAIK